MDLLKSRLVEASGISAEYQFVPEEADNGKLLDSTNPEEEVVVHVKTLIWEVVLSDSDSVAPDNGTSSSQNGSFFFATALRYQDRVNEEKLKELMMEECTSTTDNDNETTEKQCLATRIMERHQDKIINPTKMDHNIQVTSLNLAETGKAEELTGFMSGTIPPMGHSTRMHLLIDQALLSQNNNGNKKRLIMSTGSGSFRHSLWMELNDMIRFAEVLNAGVSIAAFSNPPIHSTVQEVPTSIKDPINLVPGSSEETQYLSEMLREACLKKGTAASIRDVICRAGDRFPKLFEQLPTTEVSYRQLPAPKVTYSRNPMHLAAWKGDLESIELLLETGKQFGLDLVNSISTGEGNYGKTPLFYAINQGRDDVVRFLLDRGANVLVVNRNGNTPCGMAKGRLLPETCEVLIQMETLKLKAGEVYQNYRLTETDDTTSQVAGPDVHTQQASFDQPTKTEPSNAIAEVKDGELSPLNIKKLSKKLRDSAGKMGKVGIVRGIIEEVGDRFSELVKLGSDGNFTKNALHLATWKGDAESIELLISAGNKHGLDLVNVISTGEGNYGKTPIFYAITQDRDDIVKLLLERGANLLIVNNKGQTPCSMSVTHLEPETCELMFEKEYKQIRSGGKFQNYRVSHPDDKQYGDLDPRFYIDPINYGVDIVAGLEQFRETLNAFLDPSIGIKQPSYQLLPKSFEPRSLRPTTKEFRQSRAERFRANHSTSVNRVHASKLPSAKDVLAKTAEEKKESDGGRSNVEGTSDQPQLGDHDNSEPVEMLPRLQLRDLSVGEASGDHTCQATVLNEEGLIAELSNDVSVTLAMSEKGLHNDETSRTMSDARLVELSWGLDCEWKPSRDRGRENPVATLQLSSHRRAFLIDLQNLCQSAVKDPETKMTETEAVLCETLTMLFSNPSIPIIGFGIGQDISKLAVSFPHMPCFRRLHAVVDLDTLFHNCFPQYKHKELNSLQKGVSHLLRKRLDKSEQCSNWQQRPLTASQIEYACLDAAVLPRLLREALLIDFKENNHANADGFFQKYPHLLVSWEISLLDERHMDASLGPKSAYRIENGTAKNLLALWYAKQTWTTGKTKPPPPHPIPFDSQQDTKTLKLAKEAKKEETKQKAKVERLAKRKKNPLKLSTVSTVATLPQAGQHLGYTKEACIVELLAASVLDSLIDDYYLGFNRRGGIIQMQNSWLLFVNFGGGVHNRKFINKFSDHGRFVTFTVDPRKDLDARFYEFVSLGSDAVQKDRGNDEGSRILLFVRPHSNSQYLFCGQCDVVGEEVRSGNIDLLLKVLDYSALETTSYMAIVE